MRTWCGDLIESVRAVGAGAVHYAPRAAHPRTAAMDGNLITAVIAFSLRYALCAWFFGWAVFYAWTTACAVLNFGWRQPMFDEYVMYSKFLDMPFPDNVLQLGNGHRPIFPNLVIVAENKWFGANHLLQLAGGLASALLTCVLVALTAWRERPLSNVARAAGVLIGVLGVLWLANARMLLHSYESLHIYLLILCISIAGLCTYEAACRSTKRWLAGACAACGVAMFCFGSGVASFPAVILLGFALRLPWRWLMMPVAVLAFCLFLYLYALPGNEGVRSLLAFHPLKSALIAADWLSSPWVHAVLGHADPPREASTTNGLLYVALGPSIVASANAVQSLAGISWPAMARFFGVLGIVAFLARFSALALNRRERATRLQVLASMFCLFALASAAVISSSRLDYFQQYPLQVYADRYLVWSSLFWAGLALLFLADMPNVRSRILIGAALTAAVMVPLVLLPTQHVSANWGRIVYQTSQQLAAAARSDVFDSAIYPNGDDASRSDVLRSLALLRENRLAMYAEPSWQLVGTKWHGTFEQSDEFDVEAHLTGTLVDGETGIAAARIEGVVAHGVAAIQREGQLAILDENDMVVGLAEFSFVRDGADALRFDLPRKRGFNGYIRDYQPGNSYRLVLLRPKTMRAILLRGLAAGSAKEAHLAGIRTLRPFSGTAFRK